MSRRVVILAAAVLLVAAQARAQSPGARVLVMPFENAQQAARYQWLAVASAVLLEDTLNARGVPAITRTERVRAFEELHLPQNTSLTRATVIKVGELVGASEVIVGSFVVQDASLRVTARSVRIEVGRVAPEAVERGPLSDLFTIYERLASRLVSVPPGSPPAPSGSRPPLGAFENYIKGLMAESAATRATFLENAIREYPTFDQARLALWSVRHEQGDHAAALASVRAVASASPASRSARFLGAISMLSLKQYDEAFGAFKQLLDEATARHDSSRVQAALLNNLGVVLIRRGATPQTGTPVYFLTKAADADPTDPDYQFNLGYAYALDRNNQGAVYWLRETVRREPADADAHLVMALALQASGSVVEAGREKELARQLSARYEERERRSGTDPLAIPKGLERVQLDPAGGSPRSELTVASVAQHDQHEQAVFHLERGRRLFEREQDREALDELRRAVFLSPYEAEAHLLIGRIYVREGRVRDAINALKISIWSEDTAAARIALADAYLKTNESGSARTQLERALQLDPASSDARKMLQTIK
jgi:Tfp pilus assembly protein PilF/TolB-like protein